MYKKQIQTATSIAINEAAEGETLEQKIDRAVNNGEPIEDGAEPIYTQRADGILPQYDVRTDRFEIAIEAADKIAGSRLAQREKSMEDLNKKTGGQEGKKPEENGQNAAEQQS